MSSSNKKNKIDSTVDQLEWEKFDKFSIQLGERDAGFTVDDVKIVTRLIEGEFPNYRGLIPDSHPNRLLINKENFLTVVQRVRLLARDSTPIRIKMTQENVEKKVDDQSG